MLESMWPSDPGALIRLQENLAVLPMPAAVFDPTAPVGACFVCFSRSGEGPGAAGDPGWASAALCEARLSPVVAVAAGLAGGPYSPGLLAMREGMLLEAAVRSLPRIPSVLLVDATGRDHPRRAGLALHLGAVLGIPTVGVTHRPLLAAGNWPGESRGAVAPLHLAGATVGYWVRTRSGARPLAAHAAWGTTPELAAEVVLAASGRARTADPSRAAREAARQARARGEAAAG